MDIIDTRVHYPKFFGLSRSCLLFLVSGLIWVPAVLAQEKDENRIDIGGYGSFRLDAGDAQGVGPSFTLRRFIVTTDARVGSRLRVYSEIEYERLGEIEIERSAGRSSGGLTFEQEVEGTSGSEIAVEQAWAEYRLSKNWDLRFGAILPPVGRFNTKHDDNLWNLPRRPMIDRIGQVLPGRAAWTEMGLGLIGRNDFDSGARLEYQAFLVTGTTLDFSLEEKIQTRDPKRDKLVLEAVVSPTQGAFDGSNRADAGTARISISPSLGSEYAVSAYFGQYTPDYLDVDESMVTLGFDFLQRMSTLQIEGEFLFTSYGGVDRTLDSFARSALESSTETTSSETGKLESEIEIVLNGLSDRRYGLWLDVSRPIALEPGALGLNDAVLTPVIRYERMWIDDAVKDFAFSGGVPTTLVRESVEQDRLSMGLAFRPVPGTVFNLIYSRSNAIKGEMIDPINGSDGSNSTQNSVTFGLAVGF
jgi:hypothetical protein